MNREQKSHQSPAVPGVSVIIPCYNEAASIGECLASFAGQLIPAAEIIVVDDGSTDDSAEIISRFAQESPVPVHLVAGPHRGVAAARNRGASRAGGEIILFAEGDARYADDYVGESAAALDNPEVGGVKGGLRQVWADRKTPVVRAWNHIFKGRWERVKRGELRTIGAWTFRRADFFKFGGYDETLRVGEDRDLVERIRALGLRIVSFPGGPFFHREPPTLGATCRRFFWGGRYSLPFRRRWGNIRRDAFISIVMLIFPFLLAGAWVVDPRLGLLATLFVLLGTLMISDIRYGIAQGISEGDWVGAAFVLPLHLSSKLASAAGIAIALLKRNRAAEPPASPISTSNH